MGCVADVFRALDDETRRLILDELAAKGLARPGADPKTPVVLQTFTASSLQILAGTGTKLPLHFLVGARDAAPWLTEDGLARLKAFATGLSPEKTIVRDQPDRIARAKQLGLQERLVQAAAARRAELAQEQLDVQPVPAGGGE